MSQYSRAAVIARADAANVKAAEALKSTAELKAWAIAHHQVMESRLAATLTLARREYDPAVRLARAGFPRRHFDERYIDELAESLKANGLIEPLVVRLGDERLVVGELADDDIDPH